MPVILLQKETGWNKYTSNMETNWYIYVDGTFVDAAQDEGKALEKYEKVKNHYKATVKQTIRKEAIE